jgi:hypothetical protein
MSDFTIIPSRLQFKSAPSIDQQVNLELSQTQEELTQFVRNTSLNLSQLYDDERQTCEVFRPTFKLQYLYDNTLTGTTEYIPFLNNLYYVNPEQSSVSSVWRGYPQYYEFDFFRPRITDYHFDYSPESAYTYNWTYYLTYPSTNDGSVTMQGTYSGQTIQWNAEEGIPFIISSSSEGGFNIISFQCLMSHGLAPFESVELSFDYDGDTIFEVLSLGNDNYGSSDFVFNIINPGYTGNTFFNGRMGTFKRVSNPSNLETRSKYYVRKNRVLFTQNEVDVTKTGFELNPFNNQKKLEFSSITPNQQTRVSMKTSSNTYDVTLKKDLILSGITDNRNRPVGEIFLSVVNKGYSGYFNKSFNGVGLKRGWGFNLTKDVSTWWSDNNQYSFTNIPVNSYTKTNGTTETFYYNQNLKVGDLLDGDFCEWNDYEQVERVISPLIHKIKFNQDVFKTESTPNPNAMGYYYVPHVPLTLRVFSDYVETAPQNNSENIPSYAFYSTIDQEFRWREPYLYGEFDNLDRGVNYPYLNRAHYPYRDYVFRLIPEGTNYQDILGGLNISTQPAVDDCE